MFEDTYHTIATPSEGLYKEKGSKFLAFAYPVKNVEEVKQHLEQLRKDYYDARHHCYAYILGATKEAYRANDDGEPSGTGGRPIHGQLLSADLTDTLIVVVRYFGGILLGASGLANAYKAAARDAIENATIIEKNITTSYTLCFEYGLMNEVMRMIKKHNITQYTFIPQESATHSTIGIEVRQSQSVAVYDAFSQIHGLTIR